MRVQVLSANSDLAPACSIFTSALIRTCCRRNLGGNDGIAKSAIAALTEALATVSPGGKQASFASRARANYLLVEMGSQQPRTLGSAFAKPINDADIVSASVTNSKHFSRTWTTLTALAQIAATL